MFIYYSAIVVDSFFFFFSSRRRHTRSLRDWSSDVCSSDLFVRRTFAWFPSRHEFDNAFPIIPAARWAQLLLKNWQHWSVEFFRLCNAHPMNLESDDVEPGSRKNFDNPARPQIWKSEIVRLNQHERLLDLSFGWEIDDLIQDAPVTIGKFRPQFQVTLNGF